MRDQWLANCLMLASTPASFYSGCRKIIAGGIKPIILTDIKNDLSIQDAGFTQAKLKMLTRLYFHPESHAAALSLWDRRISQGRYGSVGFTTYNHFVKSDPTKKSKRASVMGPCIQSVTLTLMPNKSVIVDAFYRTTEFLKKFPADLVFLRDTLLAPFNIKPTAIRFHFANITIHPMYWVTILPLLPDPVGSLDALKSQDRRFYDWAVKWTARYICDEYSRGIQKFAQAMRVRKDATTRIPTWALERLQAYVRKNHPGYRR